MIKLYGALGSFLISVVLANALRSETRRVAIPHDPQPASCQVDLDCPGLQHCDGSICHCAPSLKRQIGNPHKCVPGTVTVTFEKTYRFKAVNENSNENIILKRQAAALQRLIKKVEERVSKVVDVKEPNFEKINTNEKISVTMTIENPEAVTDDNNKNEKFRQRRFDLSGALADLGATGVTTTLADADWGGSCEDSSTCVLGDNLVCDAGVCICDSGYTAANDPNPPNNKKCYEDVNLGEACVVVEQCGLWMECDTVCKCDNSTSVAVSATECGPRAAFGGVCQFDPQCEEVEHAVCISGNCGCDDGYEESSVTPGVCVMIPVVTTPPDRNLGESCSTSPQCVLGNDMECSNNVCVCRSGYEEGKKHLAGKCVQPVVVNAEWVYTSYSPPLSASDTAYLLHGNTLLINIHLEYESYVAGINASLHEIISNDVNEDNDMVTGVVSYSYINQGSLGRFRKRRVTRAAANDGFTAAAKEAGFDLTNVQTHKEMPLGSDCLDNEDCIGHVSGGVICDENQICSCARGWFKLKDKCI